MADKNNVCRCICVCCTVILLVSVIGGIVCCLCIGKEHLSPLCKALLFVTVMGIMGIGWITVGVIACDSESKTAVQMEKIEVLDKMNEAITSKLNSACDENAAKIFKAYCDALTEI